MERATFPQAFHRGLGKGREWVKETSSGRAGSRHALAACWADNASRNQSPAARRAWNRAVREDSRSWSGVGGGWPVGDTAVPLHRKAELYRAPGIQGTELEAAYVATVRLQQGPAQAFRREKDCYWVGHLQNKPLNWHSHYWESNWAEQHFCKPTSKSLNLHCYIIELINKQQTIPFNKWNIDTSERHSWSTGLLPNSGRKKEPLSWAIHILSPSTPTAVELQFCLIPLQIY